MIRKFKKWEEVTGAIIDANLTLAFIITDVIGMIFTTGLCTIIGKIVEFLVGTPNWPEMVIAWVAIYLFLTFPVIMLTWEAKYEMARKYPDAAEKMDEICDEVNDIW